MRHLCVYTRVWICIRHSSQTWRKSFSLYTGSQPWNHVRWNGPRGRTFRNHQPHISFFPGYISYIRAQRYTVRHHDGHTNTHSRGRIIKKIEGERSLLICPANCGTSLSNSSTILDPIIFQEKPRRTVLYLLLFLAHLSHCFFFLI